MRTTGGLELQEELRAAIGRNESLERQLRERATELQEANERLKRESAERMWIEAALRETRLELEQEVQERAIEFRKVHESLLREISDRHRAEEARRESEAMLRAALDNAPFEFWIRDRDGRAIMQNAPSRKRWGDQIGKHPEDVAFSEEVIAIWQASNRRAYAGDAVHDQVEYELGGEKRQFQSVVAPFFVDNEIRGILGFNFDITERIRMLGMSGIELQEKLIERNISLPVIVLTAYARTRLTVCAMAAGAVTLLEKPYDEDELWDAIRKALARDAQRREGAQRQREIRSRVDQLTPGERAVMDLIVQGQPNKTIAGKLEISVRAVENRRSAVFSKMQADSVAELVRLAIDAKLDD
ncbi:MAG: LuxR C-terminal-related transcriptional regulator [Thermoguttaceae bacterium]